MTTPNNSPKITKEQAIRELWLRHNISWKLKPHQKALYDLFYNSTHKTQTWLLARRSGKTYTLAMLAIEACLREKNTIVKFLSPTKIQISSNLRPIIRDILKDCPEEIKPEFKAKDYIYYFPNGSEIQLAGSESGHYEKLRGGYSHIAIIDEAQDVTDLNDVVKSVLLPTTLTTKGKVLLAGTPPKNPDHEFNTFVEEAQLRGSLIKKTVYDNSMLTPEQIEEMKEEVGGENSEEFRREFLCVDENTLIKTINGYKKIKNIEIGELVFTHKGRYKKVLNKFLNPLGNRSVYKVDCSNNQGLICTEGHKLYISTKSKNIEEISKTEWLNVEDIDISNETYKKYFKVPIDSTISVSNYTPDLAYLIGWYLAEGHITNNTTVLSLNHNDPLNEINKLSKNIWGKEHIVYTDTGSCRQAVLCSKKAMNFYKQFGKGAKNKFIPYELKTAPDDVKIKLLQGIFSGDGYYNLEQKRAGLTSISISLISDVSDILNSLNIPHQLNKIRSAGPSVILGRKVTVQDCYSIKIFGKNFETFINTIYNIVSLSKSKRTRNFIKDGFLYSRIHRIKKIDYNKTQVYDIEVEEDHSYVGLHHTIHNCELIKDPTYSVIPEFTQELSKEIVKEWPKPPFYESYEAMDLGFKDLTVVLFAYYDFRADKVIIEDEIAVNGTNLQLPTLIEDIKCKEETLWLNPLTNEVTRPTVRVSDINYIVTQEIARASQGTVNFTAARKDDKEAAINKLRVLLQAKKIIINPRCTTLIRHLENVRWDKSRNKASFARSPDDGHYDAVDACIYMIRHINFGKNPYPFGYDSGFKRDDLFVLKPDSFGKSTTNNVEVYKKIFGIKGRK